MPDYRAYVVGDDGHYKSSEIITAQDDAAAIEVAHGLCSEHGVELWMLDRKIAILPPKSSDH